MFPFTLTGEIRIPADVAVRLDVSTAADGVARYLRDCGAADVAVAGGEVSFRVPAHSGWFVSAAGNALHPVDAGVVRVRDDGTELVLSYRVRLRRVLIALGILFTACATFGSPENPIFLVAWVPGFLAGLWFLGAVEHRFPRVFLDGVARAAGLPPMPRVSLLSRRS